MRAYGKKAKRRQTLAGHQNCGVCFEEKDDPRGQKKRARREGKENTLEGSADWSAARLESERDPKGSGFESSLLRMEDDH